jgi:cell division protein FtsI/penicillin-binding protein 2
MRRSALTALIAVLLVVAGCTADRPTPTPTPTADSPDGVAAALAAGLSRKDVSQVEFVGATGTVINQQLQALVAGMGPLKPAVTVGSVTRQGNAATATLNVVWTFPGVGAPWSYATIAPLAQDAGHWKATWQPSVVQPQLDGAHRLSQHRLYPKRGELLGEAGEPIVTLRGVFRIGLDKAEIKPEQTKPSALRLARLVHIDAAAYAKLVAAAGDQAFVEAIVLRSTANNLPRGRDLRAIPGALSIQDEQMLAPTRDFAQPIIGTVGDATKEIVDASAGAVVAGDQVGLSGLQKRYDQQLRGIPGAQVQVVAAKAAGPSPSPSPTPTASPSVTQPPKGVTVFEAKATPGRDLTTTLNPGLQRLAEKTLAKTKPPAALVAIRPSTGAIVAAANGPGNQNQSIATVGREAPGSTFKVVSALALLRTGLSPTSSVTCPRTITVDGRRFKNYSDYPSRHFGTIDLRTALAQSCNTAFIGQSSRLKGSALLEAAGSLGVGTDYDVGFPSFFGSVPDRPSGTARAAAVIGQGTVEASPMAMASVAASVAAGHTVLPHLVEGQQASSKAKPLTANEAGQLKHMMRAVVTQGSGHVLGSLSGPAVIAKTGTAEYGPTKALRTHAWMIAAQGDLAVAVFVNDGASGSHTAGPLLKAFLQGAR